MTDIVFYLCPHDLDKRRERCLMCVDAEQARLARIGAAWESLPGREHHATCEPDCCVEYSTRIADENDRIGVKAPCPFAAITAATGEDEA